MLSRHGLHHGIGQGMRQQYHGRGIASEGARGEGINQEKRKALHRRAYRARGGCAIMLSDLEGNLRGY